MAAHFSVSDNGSLVYVPGGIVRNERTLVWVDHTGKAEALPCPSGEMSPRVSPDGKQVLISRSNMKEAGYDLWVCELERGIERRLTGDEGDEWWGVWTPDSRHVVYNSGRRERTNLYWKPVDGSGPEEILVESEYGLMPYSWSADGSLFAFQECKMSTNEFAI
jgi:Tol biopolymer transport system component